MFPVNIFENCTGLFACIGQWVNSVTFGAFWLLVLIAFMIILFLATYQYGFPRAFGFSTIAGFFGSLFLVTLGFISWSIEVWFIILAVAGLAIMRLSERM
jgi:hypothetical protein